jgi:hypothetical protein
MKIRSSLYAGKQFSACDIQLKNLQRAINRGDCSASAGPISRPAYEYQQPNYTTYPALPYAEPVQPFQGGGYAGGGNAGGGYVDGVYYADRSYSCG